MQQDKLVTSWWSVMLARKQLVGAGGHNYLNRIGRGVPRDRDDDDHDFSIRRDGVDAYPAHAMLAPRRPSVLKYNLAQ